MPDEAPLRSTRRFGNFELLQKVGQGGMSSVYKARDLRTQAIVAVKIASRLVVNDQQLSRRFALEYEIAHPLSHPNLVKVLESGKHEKLPFLVMEFIDGLSVSQHLRAQKRLSETESLTIILPVANAVSYLHSKQIIHRDIKPANILLSVTGEPKLADLGLVKNLESMSRLTRSNFGLGTMQFVSPEQFDDARSVDIRSDVYSLAATLYVMLTGEYPFGKGSSLNIMERKLKNRFDPPSKRVPELRPSIDAAICKALHAERSSRPPSINAFVTLFSDEKKNRAEPTAEASSGGKTKTASKVVKERRGGMRYPVELVADCRAVVAAGGKRWPAWIIDISKSGLCLHAQRRFEVGSVLEVSFTLQSEGSNVNQVARVRWAKATQDRTWLLGCEFVNAIAEEDLNSICAEGMERTKNV
jgi:serine/threonine protein kinase